VIPLLTMPAHAALPPNLDFRGYAELRTTHQDSQGTSWQTVERLRPTLKAYPLERVRLTATGQAILVQGRYQTGEVFELLRDPIESMLPPDPNGSRPSLEEAIEECGWELELEREIDEISDVLTLERLYLDWNTQWADVRIGRQSLNWGSALFINPTDVFAQNLLAEPWQEREGLEALRVNAPLGSQGMVTAVLAVGEDWTDWKAGAKAGANLGTTDIYAVGSASDDEAMVGLDIKGDLLAGLWLEGGYFLPSEDGDGHVEISAGTDYSLPILEQLALALQMSHDGSGEEPDFYEWETRSNPELVLGDCSAYGIDAPDAPDEHRSTLGRWYGLSTVNWRLRDDVSLSSALLLNLADWTGLFFPSLQYSGDSLVVNAGLQAFVGEEGEFDPPEAQTQQYGTDLSELSPDWTAMAWARWNY
jgi:hypothetical protein